MPILSISSKHIMATLIPYIISEMQRNNGLTKIVEKNTGKI